MRTLWMGVLFGVLLHALPVDAAQRSAKAKRDFRLEHSCPGTGEQRGACPGWVVDHIYPLCAGGADAPANMQWQTVAEAKTKDRWERRICKANRQEE